MEWMKKRSLQIQQKAQEVTDMRKNYNRVITIPALAGISKTPLKSIKKWPELKVNEYARNDRNNHSIVHVESEQI